MLTIETRAAGRRHDLIPQWRIPLPRDWLAGGEPLTLRDLITRIARSETLAFRARQREQSLVRVLTERNLAEQLERGRVDSGGRTLRQRVDDDEAVANAVQAFEDGLYYVFIDGTQYERLDEPVVVDGDSRITFLRLIPLAGG